MNNIHELVNPVEPKNPREHVRAFAEFLYSDMKEDESILLRIRPRESPLMKTVFAENIDQYVEMCMKHYYRYDVFSSVSFHSKEMSEKRNTSKESCTGTSVLWADIDVGDDGHKRKNHFLTLDEAAEHILNLDMKPDLWVYTGGGYHLYWKLDKRAEFPEDMALVEETNSNLASVLYGDNVQDITRIMRVPGTHNYKYGEIGLQTSIILPKLINEGDLNRG